MSLEDLFQGMLHDSVESAVEELGEERLVKILDDPNAISEAMPEVVENSARAIVKALKRAAPEMLAERRDGRSGWDARATAWAEAFTRLQRFIEREGHSIVPAVFRDDGFPLGDWVRGQAGKERRTPIGMTTDSPSVTGFRINGTVEVSYPQSVRGGLKPYLDGVGIYGERIGTKPFAP